MEGGHGEGRKEQDGGWEEGECSVSLLSLNKRRAPYFRYHWGSEPFILSLKE